MFSLAFWKAAAERSVRAFSFALAGFMGTGVVAFGEVDWAYALSASGVAALLSVLASISVNSVTGTGPAIVDAEQTVAKDEVVVPLEAIFTRE